MGNQSAKTNSKLFTADELKVIQAAFRAAGASHSEKLPKEKLLESWSSIIDTHLAECTANFLYTSGQQQIGTITTLRFGEPFYITERGTNDQRLSFLAGSLDKTESNQFPTKELEKYVAALCKSYLIMQEEQAAAAFESWKIHGYQSAERTILAFAKGLIRNLQKDSEHYFTLDQLERWLQSNPIFLIIWNEVFTYLYNKNAGKLNKLGNAFIERHIIPVNEGIPSGTNYTPILDLPHVLFINSNLPSEFRNKWRFMFSSKIMGQSFSTMLGKIQHKGPTLIIVEDEDRYIFGGYAPDSWALRPQFVGNNSSVLLTLSPAMRCFNATSYNDHYQYLNINQQTMPNGLGMGGQFNYWGLWIDCDYGVGQSSESCTTYLDYVQLSKRKDFLIRNLEVWAIGDEPKVDEDDDERPKGSILDKNLEDRVLMELAGKKIHSEGLREPDMDL